MMDMAAHDSRQVCIRAVGTAQPLPALEHLKPDAFMVHPGY